ncbi:MAG: hypothetical protein ACI85Q_002736, partial [Salibacteraceae bacterium]
VTDATEIKKSVQFSSSCSNEDRIFLRGFFDLLEVQVEIQRWIRLFCPQTLSVN